MTIRSQGRFTKPLPDADIAGSRDAALVGLAENERVAHIGCADTPFTAEKLLSGSTLQQRLHSVADEVLGVDIDAPAIDLMRSTVPGRYIVGDIEHLTESQSRELDDFAPSLVMAGDIIEHLSNPGRFLETLIRLKPVADGARVVVSTPNALALRNIVHTAFGREIVHPDHCIMFGPATLEGLLRRYRLAVVKWIYYPVRSGESRPRRALDGATRLAARAWPAFSDGMIVVAEYSVPEQ